DLHSFPTRRSSDLAGLSSAWATGIGLSSTLSGTDVVALDTGSALCGRSASRTYNRAPPEAISTARQAAIPPTRCPPRWALPAWDGRAKSATGEMLSQPSSKSLVDVSPPAV